MNKFIWPLVAAATLASCSGTEEKIPQKDIEAIFINIAIEPLERAANSALNEKVRIKAAQILEDYRIRSVPPITVNKYSCSELATDTFDCSGDLTAKDTNGTNTTDFDVRVVWKDGKLKTIGPVKIGGNEVLQPG